MSKRSSKPGTNFRIDAFDLKPGRIIAGKYVVQSRLGQGWEGEVYRVVERRTDITRAAKLFYPQRNVRDRAVNIYAKKLNRLRRCASVIQYHHSESIRFRGIPVTCLISELVEGELLTRFIERHPGKRLHFYEALHLIRAIAAGIEQIHSVGEYHGDLHSENVLVEQIGVRFEVRVVDFYNWGTPTAAHRRDDVIDVVRLLYDAVGGKRWYARQPQEVKAICLGRRTDLITKKFPTMRRLRKHLDRFTWSIPNAGA